MQNIIMKNLEKSTIKYIKGYSDLAHVGDYNLVALNLMTLANIEVFHHKRNIYWVDGAVGRFFLKIKGHNCRRLPGRDLLRDFLQTEMMYDIVGSIPEKFELKHRVRNHYELLNYRQGIDSMSLSQLGDVPIICTLPSPLQEDFAQRLGRGRILCIGGAMNMLYTEASIPVVIEKLGLEFVWRLRSDTRRRLSRLMRSSYYFLLNLRNIFMIEADEI